MPRHIARKKIKIRVIMVDLHASIPLIEKIIADELSMSHAPGLVVGIVHEKEIVFAKGFGFADIERKKMMTTATVMKWASISKLFTCIGMLQQWELKKFQLDDAVNQYLPKGKIIPKKKSWPEVTFEHLLTHTAGIGEIRRGADLLRKGFRLITYDEKPVPPLSSLHDLPLLLASKPGLKYAYANIGGSLLGYLMELLSGEDFRQYMIMHVLDPLGMDHADFEFGDRINAFIATGYKIKKYHLVPATPWHNIIKPSGGLMATLEDMVKFASCLLYKGEYAGGHLVEPETLDLAWTPHYWPHEAFKDDDSLGYIFWLQRLNGKRIIWHTGGISGFTSTFDLIPEDGVALLTCANLSETLGNRITLRLRHRILKVLTGAENTFDPSRFQPDKSYWPLLKGTYGGWPGSLLANTRIIVRGITFKIFERDGHLVISSLFGEHKRGTVLYPTENPLVYEYPRDDAGDIGYTSRIGFTFGDKDKQPTSMSIGELDTVRKIS
jgi:CubicO group peptidase (beta-lactamase class C family)